MSLMTMNSPFVSKRGALLASGDDPNAMIYDPTKIAAQAQVDPRIRAIGAQLFGDPASRQFVQDSGNVLNAMARPDNPWNPGQPIVAQGSAPGTPGSAGPGVAPGSASNPSADNFLGVPSAPAAGPSSAPSAALSTGSYDPGRLAGPGSTPTYGEPQTVGSSRSPAPLPPGTPYAGAEDYASRNPGMVAIPGRPVDPMAGIMGARKAMFLAFLGLNKFGAGMAHQSDSYADQFLGREMESQAVQRKYDQDLPLLRTQADNAAYNQFLGQEQAGANIKKTYSEIGMGPVQRAVEDLHTGLIQRWQSNIDADAPAFLQNANEQLKGAAPQVQSAIAPLLNSITQLPRSAPNFKVTNGTVEPLLYRGQSYGLQPSANEPPEVTQARTAAMGSLQQGELAKLDPIIRGQLGEPPVNGQVTAAQKANGITDMASYMQKAQKIKETINTAGVRIQLGAFGNADDPALRPLVDAVGTGKMDMNTALQRVTPAGRANFVNALYAAYPDYREAGYDVQKKTMEYFTSGEGGKNINAFNTASDHLDQLSQLSKGLQNGDVQLVNKAANAWKTATGEAAPTNFNMVKNAVAGEIAKTFKGNATEGEISSINDTINNAMSPEQLDGAIGQAKALMHSKLHANLQQYLQGVQGKPAFETPAEGTGGGVNDLIKKYK